MRHVKFRLELVFIPYICIYVYLRSGYARDVRTRFQHRFKYFTVAHRITIHRIEKKTLRNTGSLLDKENRIETPSTH